MKDWIVIALMFFLAVTGWIVPVVVIAAYAIPTFMLLACVAGVCSDPVFRKPSERPLSKH